jgi:hypothetical protein
MLVLVIVAVIVIAAVALLAVRGAGGRRLLSARRRGPARRGPATAGRRERPSWAERRGTTDERVLLAEGEEIQERVEARLSARGVAPHRLSGPNPPTVAERLTPPTRASQPQPQAPVVAPSGAAVYGAPGTGLPDGATVYGAPGTGLPDGGYVEPDPLVPGEPGYDDALLGGRRRLGSRWSARNLRH